MSNILLQVCSCVLLSRPILADAEHAYYAPLLINQYSRLLRTYPISVHAPLPITLA
ncbi:hypothetical protein C8Q78DRAFT_998703 [Trametes maxima]|nr:hypothetical protein C8Q78DRAFT_998703 [Trametes maxima]